MENPVYREQEKELQLYDICREILGNSRNELYLSMRFLDVALSDLEFMPDYSVNLVGTDGFQLAYHPEALVKLYRADRRRVNRAYLHILIHCLFAHMMVKKERDENLWDLSCDIAAEFVIDRLYIACVHGRKSQVRRETYQSLKSAMKVVTAQSVYQWLEGQQLASGEVLRLHREFYMDDHSLWNQDKNKPREQERQQKWDDVRDKMQTEMETFSKEASEDSRSLYEQVCVQNRQRYDYKEFLRKFCVLKEEIQVDLDSFDYIFYNYGMELYGNMPLIEPQETKEVHRIEDFVIVIDTSMSCKGELVQKFLEETYSVLSEAESFSRRIQIHLVQCDERIQNDTVITNKEQMEAYMRNFQVIGQGGTDFRPAFAYVDQLLQQGAFHRLRGLIYFTDGYGRYPVKKPDYETAFVFMKDDYQDVDVPPWAIKLIIEADMAETPGRA